MGHNIHVGIVYGTKSLGRLASNRRMYVRQPRHEGVKWIQLVL
jgi:hypothetical protein